MPTRAFITGITGQDGSYLAELLLDKGYEVYGLQRRTSLPSTGRLRGILDRVHLIEGDLTDLSSLHRALQQSKPDEVYNLAAQSHVATSFTQPLYTAQVTGLGVLNLIEAIKHECPHGKLYQASSSEMFGRVEATPQQETTPFHPRSPYGSAKVFAHHAVINARESGLFACNGILFNHESPRRGSTFVTKKIAEAVARIAYGSDEKIELGNIDSLRDWGYAKEYVYGMWLMLQHETPDDYILATGEHHSVRQFLQKAFTLVGVKDWEDRVVINPSFYRPTEVDTLLGNWAKAYTVLGWKPETKFSALVELMVDFELDKLSLGEEYAEKVRKQVEDGSCAQGTQG